MTQPIATGTYLDRILAHTVGELEDRRVRVPLPELESQIVQAAPLISLRDSLATPDVGIIAEIKRASPSKGLIAEGIQPAEIARDYITGGCSAISVLTDREFFQGSLADLEAVADVAHAASEPCPVLRKDFIIDEYQIFEARAYGADIILLIVAALDDETLRRLYECAQDLGLDVLVEVHDRAELDRARRVDPEIIGINNRNLSTFDVDLATTEQLASEIDDGILCVGESGIYTRADVLRLGLAGVDAVLVGEFLMRQNDREHALRELLGTDE